jgi:hypothetical protein
MRRLLIVIAFLACCAWPALVSAHTPTSDGAISAELHVEPDHNPLSGVPTNYELLFKDTANKFTLANCDCMATITLGENRITQQLQAVSTLQSANTVTFAAPGTYQIVVTGQPKAGASFKSFKLTYAVSVRDGDKSERGFPWLLLVGTGVIIAIVLVIACVTEIKYTRSKPGSKT